MAGVLAPNVARYQRTVALAPALGTPARRARCRGTAYETQPAILLLPPCRTNSMEFHGTPRTSPPIRRFRRCGLQPCRSGDGNPDGSTRVTVPSVLMSTRHAAPH